MDWELELSHKLVWLYDNQKDHDFHPSREKEDEEDVDVDGEDEQENSRN